MTNEQAIQKAVEQTTALRCPLCGSQNDCGVVLGKPCWCERTVIPALLRERVSPTQCICKACVEQYAREVESC